MDMWAEFATEGHTPNQVKNYYDKHKDHFGSEVPGQGTGESMTANAEHPWGQDICHLHRVVRWHALLSCISLRHGHAQCQGHYTCTICFCTVHHGGEALANSQLRLT